LAWIEEPPVKDDEVEERAPELWVCLRSAKGTCREGKKRVNPHSFRHARATHLANHLREDQMKEFSGWTQADEMGSIYVQWERCG